MSTSYTARAVREGPWWVVHVDDVGVTQGRTLHEAEEMARDLVAINLDIPVDTVQVTVTPQIGDGVDDEAAEARQATKAAEVAQRESAARTRAVVGKLKKRGLSDTDVAVVLGVTRQRVGQMRKVQPKRESQLQG